MYIVLSILVENENLVKNQIFRQKSICRSHLWSKVQKFGQNSNFRLKFWSKIKRLVNKIFFYIKKI